MNLKFIVFIAALTVLGCSGGSVDIWNAVDQEDIAAIQKYASNGGNLEYGAELYGETPLLHDLLNKKNNSYDALLVAGASPNTMCRSGKVAIVWAAMESDSDWLRLALKHGGDPDFMNTRGTGSFKTFPLVFAAIHGRIRNIELLAEAGADLNKMDENGFGALREALGHTQFEAVLCLLKLGADPNAALPRTAFSSNSFISTLMEMDPLSYKKMDAREYDGLMKVRQHVLENNGIPLDGIRWEDGRWVW